MLRILHNTKIDFIKQWRLVGVLIAAFLLPALIWMTVDGVRQRGDSFFRIDKVFDLGIEFTGGTGLEVRFAEPPDVAEVRRVVGNVVPDVEVQTYGSPRDIVLRAQEREHVAAAAGSAESVSETIKAALTQRYGANSYQVMKTDAVGPRVGAELRRDAIIAMLISFAVTLIYLAYRFDARLAIASVIANVHDILATFAFIKYMNIEITLFVVGGILTVIGYSLSDSVVVFDRVRELLRKGGRRPLGETLNLAINETLPRTIMTGTTVIACLIALVALGGEVLRPFAMVLLFGIIVGTASSIYVASPVLLLLEKRWPRGDGESKGMKRALAEERKHDREDKKAGTMVAR